MDEEYVMNPDEFLDYAYGPSNQTDYNLGITGYDFGNIGEDFLGQNIPVDYLDLATLPDAYAPGSFEPVYDFGQGYLPESAYTDPYVEDAGLIGVLSNVGSRALNWLGGSSNSGRTSNWQDLLNAGLGLTGMYGNYQAGRDASELSRDQLDLERDLRNRQLGIAEGQLALSQDQFGMSSGIDDMARMALGMNLMANRGRISPDQSNPWLNFMFQGRQGMFGQDPQLGSTFANNPFASAPIGAMVSRAPESFLSSGNRPQQLASGGLASRMAARAGVVPQQTGLSQRIARNLGMTPAQQATERMRNLSSNQISTDSLPTPQISDRMLNIESALSPAASQIPPAPMWTRQQAMARRRNSLAPSQAEFMNSRAPINGNLANDLYVNGVPQPQSVNNVLYNNNVPWDWTGQNQLRNRPIGDIDPQGRGALGASSEMIPGRVYAMANGGQYNGGGLGQISGYLAGGSSGQADDVNANLSHGEYVFDADTVAALGDGNSEAGAKELDHMREMIRAHKRSAPVDKIPPKSKGALAYLRSK